MRLTRTLRQAYLRSRVRELAPDSLKIALRRRWVRLARRIGYPISSQYLPRPPLRRGRRPLRLTRVLLASDLNRRYLDFWPLVSRAWREILDVEPTLVLVASAPDLPPALRDDPLVHVFEPVDGVHTAFQAQCVRLLYPALLDGDGAVLVSDMELMPLSPGYFHGSLAGLDARFFVVYRDVHHPRGEVAIPYNAAEPRTWQDVTGVADEEDVRASLAAWARGRVYDGVRGGEGWYTDQLTLFRLLTTWPESAQRLWMLDDEYTGFRRLERAAVEGAAPLDPRIERDVRARRYTDYNAVVPHERAAALNERVVALAVEASRARSDR